MAPFFQKTKTTTPVSPGTTATGGLSERNRQISQQKQNQGFDPSGFSSVGADRSKPPQLTQAKGISPFRSNVDVDKIINDVEQRKKQFSDSASFARFLDPIKPSGVAAFEQPGGMGLAKNLAEQVLGFDTYSKALNLGYKPSELINMVDTARGFDRGINVDKFKTDLDRFEAFQMDGPGTQFDGETFLSVSRPEISANPPEGVMGLLGAMFSPFADMASAGADFVLGGGATGRILEGIKNQFNQGRDFVGQFTNPGNLSQRLDAAGPEARRKYALFLSQGDPYQVAFQKATGQAFAHGGVASL